MSFFEKTTLGSSTDSTEVADVLDGKLPVSDKGVVSTLESSSDSAEDLLLKIVELQRISINQQKLTNLYLQNIWGKGEFKTRDIED